jgi:tripartite-type tricarboxylate transporter receptor subunit TctC
MNAYEQSPVFQRIAILLSTFFCAAAAQPAFATEDAQCKQMAQGYPSRNVTLVVGFPPGGQTDQIGRIVAEALSARLSHPVVVDNRGGAGGTIGAAYVARAPSDGHALFLATMGTHAINSALYPKLSYDHIKDFKAVAYVTNAPNVFLARADSPVKSMAELLAAVKEKSRPINIALPGNGTSPHLSSALFESMTGIQMQSIMYRGNAPALADVLGGQVEFLVDSVTTALPHIQRGALRALGVTTATRSALLPNVPSVSEHLPGYEVNAWWGIVAPSGMPVMVAERLNCEINQALKDPKLMDRFKKMGAVTQSMTTGAFANLMVQDTAKWERIIKGAGIKLE